MPDFIQNWKHVLWKDFILHHALLSTRAVYVTRKYCVPVHVVRSLKNTEKFSAYVTVNVLLLLWQDRPFNPYVRKYSLLTVATIPRKLKNILYGKTHTLLLNGVVCIVNIVLQLLELCTENTGLQAGNRVFPVGSLELPLD
jgi:hypothetical protein